MRRVTAEHPDEAVQNLADILASLKSSVDTDVTWTKVGDLWRRSESRPT
jgi:hypothetical protein